MTRTWYNHQWTPALSAVIRELERAESKFGPFRNTHEGYAVLLEEVDELWDAIKANDKEHAKKEAIQVAAMGLRFLLNLYEWEPENTKALEAQLGAVTSGVVPVSAADCSGSHTTPKQGSQQAGESGSGSAAAPSVSADSWQLQAELHRRAKFPAQGSARACDLAAAVTRWYETPGCNDSDEADLMDIAGAFCRGEKLPEVGS